MGKEASGPADAWSRAGSWTEDTGQSVRPVNGSAEAAVTLPAGDQPNQASTEKGETRPGALAAVGAMAISAERPASFTMEIDGESANRDATLEPAERPGAPA